MRRAAAIAIVVAACGSHAAAPPPVQPQSHETPTPPAQDDPPAQQAAGEAQHFEAKAMCVTHGSMHQLHVSESSMRAFARGSSGEGGAVEFTYVGPTKQVSHLASGDVREQLGLKLRAADGCNLVYVVWRFAPKPELVVQTKINPGAHTNAECGTSGYERITGDHIAVSAPAPGSKHVLAARIDGDTLVASVDGKVAWTGQLPASARELRGPLGVRTDNVEADLALVGTLAQSQDDDERCHARGAD